MHLEKLDVDSQVFGFDVWEVKDCLNEDDFTNALDTISKNQTKSYISCKLPVKNLSLINAAEKAGFEFVETQFETSLRIRDNYDLSKYPYRYVQVTNEDQLQEVLYIAENTIEHDRYSLDELVGKKMSGARYAEYLKLSFLRANEQIWCVQSEKSGKLLTFRSHRGLDSKTVQLLIGGVHPDFKDVGLGIISSHYCFTQLRSAGVTRAVTHISASNIPIINLEIGHFDFKVRETFVILRTVINHPN